MRLGVIRQLHVYISAFVAPSLLFFAITGALQTFRIPDEKAAPVVIQKLARLHKDDVFALKPPRPNKAEAAQGHDKPGPEKPQAAKPPEKPSITLMKWFFTAVSIGIGITTLFGVWMAITYSRNKVLVWLLLIAGIAAPIVIAGL